MMNTEKIIRGRLKNLSYERDNILCERKSAEYYKNECIKNAKDYAEKMLNYDAALVVLEKEIDFMMELLDKENREDSAE